MTKTEYAIEVIDLTKQFSDKVVVDHISLQVKKGSIFGFLGSNGSGKTTTIRMICGLLKPTSGSGKCLGYDIQTENEAIKRNIGYMPQTFSFYTELTVTQNLQFISDIYQINNSKQRITEIIDDLELGPYRHIRAKSLSGGWKQRLSLACCLIHKPQLLFLDEPTAGVDPKARKDFWDYLNKVAHRDGTTILVTTHYMDEAEKCSNLGYINLGSLLYSGTTKDLLPFSKVKTYEYVGDISKQQALFDKLKQDYPKILTSIVNNSLRVSSKDYELLDECIRLDSDDTFKPTRPSFEEIFIGLMR